MNSRKKKIETLTSEQNAHTSQIGNLQNENEQLKKEFDDLHKTVQDIQRKLNTQDRKISTVTRDQKTTLQRLLSLEFATRSCVDLGSLPDFYLSITNMYGFVCINARFLAVFEQDIPFDEFFRVIVNKPNIVVVVLTDDGTKFGVSFTRPVKHPDRRVFDEDICLLTFVPQRKDGKDKAGANDQNEAQFENFGVCDAEKDNIYVKLSSSQNQRFFCVESDGVGQLRIGLDGEDSFCKHLSRIFDRVDDRALTKHTVGQKIQRFSCQKVVVLQTSKAEPIPINGEANDA